MEPYFRRGDIALYHCDNRELEAQIDLPAP